MPVANHLCPSSFSEMSPLGPVGVHTPKLDSSRALSSSSEMSPWGSADVHTLMLNSSKASSSSSEVHVSSSEGAYAQKPVDKELLVGKQLCKGFRKNAEHGIQPSDIKDISMETKSGHSHVALWIAQNHIDKVLGQFGGHVVGSTYAVVIVDEDIEAWDQEASEIVKEMSAFLSDPPAGPTC